VDLLTEKMKQSNFHVNSMHGDMPQKKINAIIKEFQAGQT
jgi:superfamily II DNA/RNA helicase